MISINEMRIGSLVQMAQGCSQGNAKPGDVVRYDIDDFEYCRFDCFDPVPLTEEWLLRLGFKHAKSDSDNYWQADYWYVAGNDDIQILQEDDNLYLMGYDWQEGIKTIDFVHSLQNLFHALTGQELKINEDGVG